jgi:hypothetical protein
VARQIVSKMAGDNRIGRGDQRLGGKLQSTTGQITVLYDIIEAAPATRTDSGIAVRFHVRARRPIQHGRLAHIVPAATHQAGAPAHAAPCVRFQAGQRRRRYQGLAGLPRPQEHSAYGALHGTGAYEVQGVLAGLIGFCRFQEQCVSIGPTSPSKPRMESSRCNRQRFVRIGKGRY